MPVGRELKWSPTILPAGIHSSGQPCSEQFSASRSSHSRFHRGAQTSSRFKNRHFAQYGRCDRSDSHSCGVCRARMRSASQRVCLASRSIALALRGGASSQPTLVAAVCNLAPHFGRTRPPASDSERRAARASRSGKQIWTFVTVNLELLRKPSASPTCDIARTSASRRHEQSRPPGSSESNLELPVNPGAALRIAKQTWGDKLRLRRVPLLRGRKMLICRVIP